MRNKAHWQAWLRKFDLEAGMSNEINGGPAFPRTASQGGFDTHEVGMMLRDYFAAKAMQAFMQWALVQKPFEDYNTAAKAAAGYAKASYLIADAMLAAREVKP
jgi:hypothetical protein